MPTPDPIARRIRERRQALGLTLERLAETASRHLTAGSARTRRGAAVSVSYLSLIENGRKVPGEAVALALAAALDEDPALFGAWIAARKRADLDTALAAARTLSRTLGTGARTPALRPPAAPVPGGAPARLRVPVVPEGADPGEGVRPSCAVLGWRALDLAALPEPLRARVRRPFAFQVGADAARHCAPWAPETEWDAPEPPRAGDHVVVLRDFEPLEPATLCAVRTGGGLALRRAIWNGAALLLLPAQGAADFAVLDAPEPGRLRALVVGRAVRLVEAR